MAGVGSSQRSDMDAADPLLQGEDRSVPCVQCGYDLRGLALGNRCPECGTPVVVSHSGVFADAYVAGRPEWLRRLASGARMGGRVHPLLTTVAVVGPLLGATLALSSFSRGIGSGLMTGILCTIVMGLGWIMRCIWLVTTRPPLRVLRRRDELARCITRIAAILVIAAITYLSWGILAGWVFGRWELIVLRVGSPVGIAGLAGGVAFGVYCRRLAEILLEPRLIVEIRWRLRIFVFAGIVSAIGQFIATWGSAELGGVLIACATFAQVISGASLLMMPRQFLHRLESIRAAGGAYSVEY